MNYYKILRLNRTIKSNKLKIIGVGGLFLFRRRYLNIFLDPILNCNFKCLMCYYSDPDFKPERKRLKDTDLGLIADNFFKYAIKLQIGCGAEPSLYTNNAEIIRLAKKYNVPHISFTTNASILNYSKIRELAAAGLDEIIISMHGTQKEVYEKMMPGSSYDKLHEVFEAINKIKEEFSNFKLRINYTVNPDNIEDLKFFGEYIERYSINVLQIRPIRKLGNTAYSDFNLIKKQEIYSEIISGLEEKCKDYGVISLISHKLNENKIYRKEPDIAKYTYCYISPNYYGTPEFKPENSLSFRKFLIKNSFYRNIFKDILKKTKIIESSVEFGNYDVTI